jgi:hypothetical protein
MPGACNDAEGVTYNGLPLLRGVGECLARATLLRTSISRQLMPLREVPIRASPASCVWSGTAWRVQHKRRSGACNQCFT